MMQISVFTKGREVTFESKLTNDEAYNALAKLVGSGKIRSNFAGSLTRYKPWNLSPKQMSWVHKLVFDQTEVEKAPAEAAITLKRLVCMMILARENGLKWPVLRTKNLRVSWRRDGHLNLVSADKVEYYGVIRSDDFKLLRRKSLGEFLPELLEMNENPIDTARMYGRITGNCCFCGKELSHHSSIEVGYGPICADRWGLPHEYEAKDKKKAVTFDYPVGMGTEPNPEQVADRANRKAIA